jgi:O-antigen ligase
LWSGDPLGSAKRIVKDFGLLFVVAVILTEANPLEAIRAIYYRCACVLFPLSVVLIKYFPNYARDFSVAGAPLYTGVTTQKNTLGESVLVLTLILLFDYLETREVASRRSRMPWDYVLLVSIAFWLLHMSQSKTALVCLVISSALVLRTGWLSSRMVSGIALMGALSLPVIVLLTQSAGSLLAGVVEALGRNMTFTGRTNIWEHITLNTVDPLRGAGYWNFWGGPHGHAIAAAMMTSVPNAHNGYLDIYLDGGFIGVMLLCFMLIVYGFRLAANTATGRYDRVRFAMLVAMIIYNLSESTYARLTPSWFTTLLLIIQFPFPKPITRMAETGLKLSSSYVPSVGSSFIGRGDLLPPSQGSPDFDAGENDENGDLRSGVIR